LDEPAKLKIRKNEFNNYEHAETKFVFDQKTKKVIGVQTVEEVEGKRIGKIRELSVEDILECKKRDLPVEPSIDNLKRTVEKDKKDEEKVIIPNEEDDDEELMEDPQEDE